MHTITRINPKEKTSVVANDTSTFEISDGVYDLSTLRLWFIGTINGADIDRMALPRDVETMIETLEVSYGGMRQLITNYGQIFRILEDYTSSIDETFQRSMLSNSLSIPNNTPNAQFNVSKTPFCITKWIGFLNSKAIVRGPLTIKITWAPDNVLIARANSTYVLEDLHLTIERDNRLGPTHVITYNGFLSTTQYNTSYNQITQMDVVSPYVDYVMATFQPLDYKTRASNTTTSPQATSYYFSRSAQPLTWNFTVNNTNMISYNPMREQGFEYMTMMLGKASSIQFQFTKSGSTQHRFFNDLAESVFCCGVKLDQDASEGLNIAFKTFSDVVRPNLSLMIVKTTEQLTMSF